MKVKDMLRLLEAQNPEAEVKFITIDAEFGIGSVESAPGYEVYLYSDEEESDGKTVSHQR